MYLYFAEINMSEYYEKLLYTLKSALKYIFRVVILSLYDICFQCISKIMRYCKRPHLQMICVLRMSGHQKIFHLLLYQSSPEFHKANFPHCIWLSIPLISSISSFSMSISSYKLLLHPFHPF